TSVKPNKFVLQSVVIGAPLQSAESLCRKRTFADSAPRCIFLCEISGLGGFGVGLTGALKVNTKEDMAENSRMIVLWGSNIASQPNPARHIISARRRGAKVVTIDVRRTEAAAQSDEVLLIRPGSDAALALAVMHVIITERVYDRAFVEAHTVGLEQLSA